MEFFILIISEILQMQQHYSKPSNELENSNTTITLTNQIKQLLILIQLTQTPNNSVSSLQMKLSVFAE